jgi:hypothetical protein
MPDLGAVKGVEPEDHGRRGKGACVLCRYVAPERDEYAPLRERKRDFQEYVQVWR